MLQISTIFATLLVALGLAVGASYYDWIPALSQRGMTDVEILSVMAALSVALAWIIWRVWFRSDGLQPRRKKKCRPQQEVAPQTQTQNFFKWLKEVTIL